MQVQHQILTACPDSLVVLLPKQMNIVCILTLIGCIIRLKLCEYGDFSDESNVFDNGFKVEYEIRLKCENLCGNFDSDLDGNFDGKFCTKSNSVKFTLKIWS